MSTQQMSLSNDSSIQSSDRIISWRIISFFRKNNAFMISPSMENQVIFIAFSQRISDNKFQSFKESIKFRLNMQELAELLLYTSLPDPLPYKSWRKKHGKAYLFEFIPTLLDEIVPSYSKNKTSISSPLVNLKFSLLNNSSKERNMFSFTPWETKIVLNLFQNFYDQLIQYFVIASS